MTRRQWLTIAAAGASGAAVSAGAQEASKVRVTDVEFLPVKVNQRGNWVLVRMRSSAGLTGLGDASHGYPDQETIAAMKSYFERLRGRSVFDVEWLRQQVWQEAEKRGRPGAVGLSGLEQCLYDLQGQALGVPCYQLFGGKLRETIRNYANINRLTFDRSPDGFAKNAGVAMRAGFDAFKLAPWDGMPRKGTPEERERYAQQGIECLRAVRRLIGPERDLLTDGHSNFDLASGLKLAEELEPLNLFWLEEVTRPAADLARINQAAKMPTAGGEYVFGTKNFLPYINSGAVDILMPDMKYCGGMLELKKVAAIAEAAGMPVAPHGPASPVGNIAVAHVCATLPNFLILEFGFGEVDWRAELIDPPELLEKGHLRVADRPGFGVRLNEKTVRKYLA